MEGDEEVVACHSVLMPGTVECGQFRREKDDVEHLKGGHLDFDQGCATCTSVTTPGRQYNVRPKRRRQAREEKFALTSRVQGRWRTTGLNNCHAVRRETRYVFVSRHWLTSAVTRSSKRWWDLAFFTVMKDESSWA